MKKFMIRTDVEGASGVVNNLQANPREIEHEAGISGMISDILAIIDGLKDAGECEIYLYDEHYWGRNIDMSKLPEGVAVYCGKPAYTSTWAGGLDESFDGMVLMGLHAKAGTEGALLNHSYEGEITDMTINGVSVGEIGVEAAIAGELGVPTILVTADSEGVRETKELNPEIRCVSVKESICTDGALCYPFSVTSKWIREAAKEAALSAASIPPVKFDGEIEFTVKLKESPYLDNVRKNYPELLVDNNRILLHSRTVLESFARYWQIKKECRIVRK